MIRIDVTIKSIGAYPMMRIDVNIKPIVAIHMIKIDFTIKSIGASPIVKFDCTSKSILPIKFRCLEANLSSIHDAVEEMIIQMDVTVVILVVACT